MGHRPAVSKDFIRAFKRTYNHPKQGIRNDDKIDDQSDIYYRYTCVPLLFLSLVAVLTTLGKVTFVLGICIKRLPFLF